MGIFDDIVKNTPAAIPQAEGNIFQQAYQAPKEEGPGFIETSKQVVQGIGGWISDTTEHFFLNKDSDLGITDWKKYTTHLDDLATHRYTEKETTEKTQKLYSDGIITDAYIANQRKMSQSPVAKMTSVQNLEQNIRKDLTTQFAGFYARNPDADTTRMLNTAIDTQTKTYLDIYERITSSDNELDKDKYLKELSDFMEKGNIFMRDYAENLMQKADNSRAYKEAEKKNMEFIQQMDSWGNRFTTASRWAGLKGSAKGLFNTTFDGWDEAGNVIGLATSTLSLLTGVIGMGVRVVKRATGTYNSGFEELGLDYIEKPDDSWWTYTTSKLKQGAGEIWDGSDTLIEATLPILVEVFVPGAQIGLLSKVENSVKLVDKLSKAARFASFSRSLGVQMLQDTIYFDNAFQTLQKRGYNQEDRRVNFLTNLVFNAAFVSLLAKPVLRGSAEWRALLESYNGDARYFAQTEDVVEALNKGDTATAEHLIRQNQARVQNGEELVPAVNSTLTETGSKAYTHTTQKVTKENKAILEDPHSDLAIKAQVKQNKANVALEKKLMPTEKELIKQEEGTNALLEDLTTDKVLAGSKTLGAMNNTPEATKIIDDAVARTTEQAAPLLGTPSEMTKDIANSITTKIKNSKNGIKQEFTKEELPHAARALENLVDVVKEIPEEEVASRFYNDVIPAAIITRSDEIGYKTLPSYDEMAKIIEESADEIGSYRQYVNEAIDAPGKNVYTVDQIFPDTNYDFLQNLKAYTAKTFADQATGEVRMYQIKKLVDNIPGKTTLTLEETSALLVYHLGMLVDDFEAIRFTDLTREISERTLFNSHPYFKLFTKDENKVTHLTQPIKDVRDINEAMGQLFLSNPTASVSELPVMKYVLKDERFKTDITNYVKDITAFSAENAGRNVWGLVESMLLKPHILKQLENIAITNPPLYKGLLRSLFEKVATKDAQLEGAFRASWLSKLPENPFYQNANFTSYARSFNKHLDTALQDLPPEINHVYIRNAILARGLDKIVELNQTDYELAIHSFHRSNYSPDVLRGKALYDRLKISTLSEAERASVRTEINLYESEMSKMAKGIQTTGERFNVTKVLESLKGDTKFTLSWEGVLEIPKVGELIDDIMRSKDAVTFESAREQLRNFILGTALDQQSFKDVMHLLLLPRKALGTGREEYKKAIQALKDNNFQQAILYKDGVTTSALFEGIKDMESAQKIIDDIIEDFKNPHKVRTSGENTYLQKLHAIESFESAREKLRNFLLENTLNHQSFKDVMYLLSLPKKSIGTGYREEYKKIIQALKDNNFQKSIRYKDGVAISTLFEGIQDMESAQKVIDMKADTPFKFLENTYQKKIDAISRPGLFSKPGSIEDIQGKAIIIVGRSDEEPLNYNMETYEKLIPKNQDVEFMTLFELNKFLYNTEENLKRGKDNTRIIDYFRNFTKNKGRIFMTQNAIDNQAEIYSRHPTAVAKNTEALNKLYHNLLYYTDGSGIITPLPFSLSKKAISKFESIININIRNSKDVEHLENINRSGLFDEATIKRMDEKVLFLRDKLGINNFDKPVSIARARGIMDRLFRDSALSTAWSGVRSTLIGDGAYVDLLKYARGSDFEQKYIEHVERAKGIINDRYPHSKDRPWFVGAFELTRDDFQKYSRLKLLAESEGVKTPFQNFMKYLGMSFRQNFIEKLMTENPNRLDAQRFSTYNILKILMDNKITVPLMSRKVLLETVDNFSIETVGLIGSLGQHLMHMGKVTNEQEVGKEVGKWVSIIERALKDEESLDGIRHNWGLRGELSIEKEVLTEEDDVVDELVRNTAHGFSSKKQSELEAEFLLLKTPEERKAFRERYANDDSISPYHLPGLEPMSAREVTGGNPVPKKLEDIENLPAAFFNLGKTFQENFNGVTRNLFAEGNFLAYANIEKDIQKLLEIQENKKFIDTFQKTGGENTADLFADPEKYALRPARIDKDLETHRFFLWNGERTVEIRNKKQAQDLLLYAFNRGLKNQTDSPDINLHVLPPGSPVEFINGNFVLGDKEYIETAVQPHVAGFVSGGVNFDSHPLYRWAFADEIAQGKSFIAVFEKWATAKPEVTKTELLPKVSLKQIDLKSIRKASMYYKMPAGSVRKDLGITGDTTTLDLIKSGDRTATTRSEPLGKNGELIKFDDSGDVYEIVSSYKLPEKINWEEWSKLEGWDPAYIQKHLSNQVKPGAWQTVFKKLDLHSKPEDAAILSDDDIAKKILSYSSKPNKNLVTFKGMKDDAERWTPATGPKKAIGLESIKSDGVYNEEERVFVSGKSNQDILPEVQKALNEKAIIITRNQVALQKGTEGEKKLLKFLGSDLTLGHRTSSDADGRYTLWSKLEKFSDKTNFGKFKDTEEFPEAAIKRSVFNNVKKHFQLGSDTGGFTDLFTQAGTIKNQQILREELLPLLNLKKNDDIHTVKVIAYHPTALVTDIDTKETKQLLVGKDVIEADGVQKNLYEFFYHNEADGYLQDVTSVLDLVEHGVLEIKTFGGETIMYVPKKMEPDFFDNKKSNFVSGDYLTKTERQNFDTVYAEDGTEIYVSLEKIKQEGNKLFIYSPDRNGSTRQWIKTEVSFTNPRPYINPSIKVEDTLDGTQYRKHYEIASDYPALSYPLSKDGKWLSAQEEYERNNLDSDLFYYYKRQELPSGMTRTSPGEAFELPINIDEERLMKTIIDEERRIRSLDDFDIDSGLIC